MAQRRNVTYPSAGKPVPPRSSEMPKFSKICNGCRESGIGILLFLFSWFRCRTYPVAIFETFRHDEERTGYNLDRV